MVTLFCNCKTDISQLRADFLIKIKELESETARLETMLASIRGVVNAKLGGKEFKKRKNRALNDDDDDENDDPFADLSAEEREFINGLSIQERESLLNRINSSK